MLANLITYNLGSALVESIANTTSIFDRDITRYIGPSQEQIDRLRSTTHNYPRHTILQTILKATGHTTFLASASRTLLLLDNQSASHTAFNAVPVPILALITISCFSLAHKLTVEIERLHSQEHTLHPSTNRPA